MLLHLWNFLRGYVMIHVSGFAGERLLSMAAYRGLLVWDVTRTGDGLTLFAAASDVTELREVAQKAGCGCEVCARRGLPVWRRRCRGRYGWGAGVLLFAVGLSLLSSMIWTVMVEGNHRLSRPELLALCREAGLSPGRWKSELDARAIGEALLLRCPELSWASVTIRGTEAVVRVAETIPAPEAIDRSGPMDLAASRSGVIVSITAAAGTQLVQPGDVVEAGQVLISSRVAVKDAGEEVGATHTHAAGQVTARVWYEVSDSLPLVWEEKHYTGETRENGALLLGHSKLDVWQPRTEGLWEWETLSQRFMKLGDYALPLGWERSRARAYTREKREWTEEEAETRLRQRLAETIENRLPDEAVWETTEYTFWIENQTLRGRAVASVQQRIEVEQPAESEEEPSGTEEPGTAKTEEVYFDRENFAN